MPQARAKPRAHPAKGFARHYPRAMSEIFVGAPCSTPEKST